MDYQGDKTGRHVPAIFYRNRHGGINHQGHKTMTKLMVNYSSHVNNSRCWQAFFPEEFPEYLL